MDRDQYFGVVWSAIWPDESIPRWLVPKITWAARQLPQSVQDDFASLVALEMLEYSPRTLEDVRRVVDRIRHRVLSEIGGTGRSSHRKSVSLQCDPPDNLGRFEEIAYRNEILEMLQTRLNESELRALYMFLAGETSQSVAHSLGEHIRKIQRIRQKIASFIQDFRVIFRQNDRDR